MKRIIKITALMLAALTLLCACGKQGATVTTVDYTWTMKTDGFSLTPGQFTYFYDMVCDGYASYAEHLGFSTDKPLDEQKCKGGTSEDYTWHDYFVDETMDQLKDMLYLYQAALDKGLTLDAEKEAMIEENISNLHKAAETQGVSVESLIAENYGSAVTEDDMRTCMRIQFLSSAMSESLTDDIEYTDEELEAECAADMATYYSSECLRFDFTVQISSSSKTEELEKAKADAKAQADKLLAAAKDEESFITAVREYLTGVDGISEDKIEQALEDVRQSVMYSKNTDYTKWIFEQDADGAFIRKSNEVKNFYSDANGRYTVCLILEPAGRADYAVRDVRHLLISVDSFDKELGLPDAEAKARAEELLGEMRENGVSEEQFAEMAKEYSTDGGSADDGGLYTEVGKGEMVDAFDEWLFADGRTAGDMDIVYTEYGYHIMYYVGEGETKWKRDATANLRNKSYNSEYRKLVEKYTLSVNRPCLDTIESK
ncbi:MAG: peptidyl-prolyl cis-trans isomerase [Clostridia bacterium]|nr:peptidyl-prolyl cis-trans isomerase [Clostridia bacterium]